MLLDLLNRLPEPWDMIVAWTLYLGFVAFGFAVTMYLVGKL